MRKFTIDSWANDIKASICDDVKDVAENYHAKTQKGGYFSIPRQVFCYVDYLGKIAYGFNSSTERAVKFIKDYFPKNYYDYADLIYSMWRHGTIHEYKPKDLFAELGSFTPKKIRIRWCSNSDNNNNRQENLKFFPMTGKRATLYLNINNCQLVDDLLFALNNFVNHLKKNRALSRNCKKRLKESWRYEKITKMKGKKINVVYNQIIFAWKNQSKYRIDQSGRVLKK